MNIHHLELFYYVAKHGGISEAVRNIPYGIQQPAVSAQIIQLEEFLGVTLFQRRPFSLTPAGQELFDFAAPFFNGLDAIANKLQGGTAHQIRIGASEAVLRDHLPDILQNVRQKFPKLNIALRESNQPQLEAWLEQDNLDLIVTLIQKNAIPAGFRSLVLLDIPIRLLVPKNSKIKSAAELWSQDKIDEPLIGLPPNEILSRHFQEILGTRGIDWFPSFEVSSLNLVETYVQKGYGIGLSVRKPMSETAPDLRALELPDFPPVTLGALWRGKPSALVQTFLDAMQQRARLIKV
jgi:DNA-binding transcriptional LysR family regulator